MKIFDASFRCGRLRPVLLLLIAVAACTASPKSLRVASSGDYRPFSIASGHGDIVGFDAVVARRFARDSGREAVFVPLRWPQLTEDVRVGRFDVAMSGVTMRADRTLDMLFSRPYAVTGAVVVVRRDRVGELGSLEVIDRRGVRLAVNRGGHLERLTRDRFHDATIVPVEDNEKLESLILEGQVDAVVSEQYEAANWPQAKLAILGPFTRDRKAYVVLSGRSELLGELNDWLAAREIDGWLNEQRRHWLGAGAVWTAEQSCFEAIAAAIDMRMQLMPWIAAAKWQLNLPIEDRMQEQRVLEAARKQALDLGLNLAAAVDLFRDLIEASKRTQHAADSAVGVEPTLLDLDSLRMAIRAQSRQTLVEAARCRSALRRSDLRPQLESSLRQGIPGLPAAGLSVERLASDLSAL